MLMAGYAGRQRHQADPVAGRAPAQDEGVLRPWGPAHAVLDGAALCGADVGWVSALEWHAVIGACLGCLRLHNQGADLDWLWASRRSAIAGEQQLWVSSRQPGRRAPSGAPSELATNRRPGLPRIAARLYARGASKSGDALPLATTSWPSPIEATIMNDDASSPHPDPDEATWMDLAIEAGQLREAMVARAGIEQAKGYLVAVCDITLDAAFQVLRGVSQDRNIKLRDLATALMTLASGPGPRAGELTPAHHAAAALMVRVGKSDPLSPPLTG
jgi:hypothetical protein